MLLKSSSLPRFWFWLGLFLHVGTAAWNPGLIAADDYNNAVALMIPSQRPVNLAEAMAHGVHPPVPKAIVYAVAQVPRWLGVETPRTQLALSLVLLTLAVYLAIFYALMTLVPKDRPRERAVVAFLAAAYGLSPLLFSRPMNEVLATPFLLASAALATRYFQRGSRGTMALSIAALAAASTMRFQAGVCVAVVFTAVCLRRRAEPARFLGDLAAFLGTAFAAFLATGFLDVLLLGGFHEGLRRYVAYNLHAGELHGTGPFYRYVVLFFAASLPPTLLGRYRGLNFREAYRPYAVALGYFAIFVLAHSVTPHKEERFMIPVLPLFCLLTAPLVVYWSDRPGGRWRLAFGATVNALVLVATSLMTPQKSLVDLMTWLDRTPSVERLLVYGESMPVAPVAFVRRELPLVAMDPESAVTLECKDAIAIRDDLYRNSTLEKNARLEVAGHFEPALLDAILVRANPKHNRRRGGLTLLVPRGCQTTARR